MLFLKIGILVSLFFVSVAVLGFYSARNRKNLKRQLSAVTEEYNRFLGDYSALKESNRNLSRAAAEVENSYEITRRMSGDLEFDDIFRSFNEFLNTTVKFKECKLLLTGRENEDLFIEKIYRMKHPSELGDNVVRVSSPELKDEIALDLFHEDQRPVFLSADKDSEILSGFYPRQDVKTLASNPLIVEDELIGMLVIEDLKEADYEKFLILAGQFAMEIKKVKLYETIQRLAIIDGLTGIYVRRHFLERAEEEVNRSKYHKLDISFLMADIDHFKICNDRYGHLVGDAVLSQLAAILKKNVREVDIVCRYGGEEFALALPDTDKKAALTVSERIRETVEEFTFRAYDEKPQLTISIGVSSYPADGKNLQQLIEAADRALYNAKNSGRNRVCLAS